jgi:hypothetical protein
MLNKTRSEDTVKPGSTSLNANVHCARFRLQGEEGQGGSVFVTTKKDGAWDPISQGKVVTNMSVFSIKFQSFLQLMNNTHPLTFLVDGRHYLESAMP